MPEPIELGCGPVVDPLFDRMAALRTIEVTDGSAPTVLRLRAPGGRGLLSLSGCGMELRRAGTLGEQLREALGVTGESLLVADLAPGRYAVDLRTDVEGGPTTVEAWREDALRFGTTCEDAGALSIDPELGEINLYVAGGAPRWLALRAEAASTLDVIPFRDEDRQLELASVELCTGDCGACRAHVPGETIALDAGQSLFLGLTPRDERLARVTVAARP